jgi:hypothetical protein
VWDQEEYIDVLSSIGLQELVSVMGAQAIQQEQDHPGVPESSPTLRDRREDTALAHTSNKRVFMMKRL